MVALIAQLQEILTWMGLWLELPCVVQYKGLYDAHLSMICSIELKAAERTLVIT